MATTTNYGWETPDDTDFVKDGAAAIRTLGSSIDTTLKAQIDLQIPDSIVDAKGDLITATADNTPARIAVGANNTVLTADSTTSTGLKWAVPSSGGMTLIATATPSAASSVSFASIPTTYKMLYLTYQNVTESSGWGWSVRLNNDTGNNYSWLANYLSDGALTNATGLNVDKFGATGNLTFVPYANNTATNYDRLARGQMWIQRADQAEEHQVFWQSGVFSGGYYGALNGQGIYRGTNAAVTQIDLVRLSTQTITGTFYLYGLS